MTMLVWHDGAIVDPAAPIVTATDHGVLLADGMFEALAVRDGRAMLLDRHLRRLRRGMERIGLTGGPDDASLASAISELVDVSGLVDARIRITVTAGPGPSPRQRGDRPTTFVTIDRLADAPTSVALHLVPWPRNEHSPFAGIKSINWAENAHALRAATDAGFDNALFLDTIGRLSECATANVFLVMGDVIVTPSLAAGCLEGVIREVLVEGDAATETDLFPTDLSAADGVFITTSTTGVVPVRAVDGRSFPIDHPSFERARSVVHDAIATDPD